MTATQTQIFTTPVKEHSGLKYRIEMRQNNGIWEQRHIWYPAPETYVDASHEDKWIYSGRTPPGPHYRPIA